LKARESQVLETSGASVLLGDDVIRFVR
jgi:hypothetical protein